MGNGGISRDRFLGVAPWTSYDTAKDNLSTGDIVLFSARSFVGRSVRLYTETVWSHVGIVLTPKFCEPLIMEASVDRLSLYDFKSTGRIKVSTCIQTLSSKIHSGLFDVVAIRKINWKGRSKVSSPMMSPNTPDMQSEATHVHTHSSPHKPFNSFGKSVVDMTLHAVDDALLCNLLDLSVESFQISIHPDKRDYLMHPRFFKPKYIYGLEPDDIAMLVSAEYVATIFTKVGVLETSTGAVVSKFKPFHFGSDSAYKLPIDTNNCDGFERELYIFQDYPLSLSDVNIMGKEELYEKYPKLEAFSIKNFFRNADCVDNLQLNSGDLVFFKEVTEVGATIAKITNSDSYTRVAMVIMFPGINEVFLYEAPPYFIKRSETSFPNKKLLEGNIISLNSVLRSRALSAVGIRRLKRQKTSENSVTTVLRKEGGNIIPNSAGSNHIYSYLEMGASMEDPVRQRIVHIFETMGDEHDLEIRVDVSSIFSGYFVGRAYSQLGLITETDVNKMMYYSPKKFSSEINLDHLYYLTALEEMRGS